MIIEITNPTSFVIRTDDGADKTETVFSFPKEFTNWQLSATAELLGDLVIECSDAGTTILNIVMAIASARGDGKPKDQMVSEALGELQSLFEKGFTKEFTKGTGEVLKYFGSHNILSRLAAIFFLKKNESEIDKPTFEERTTIFKALPVKTVWNGLTDFFGNKPTSSTSIPSPSATSETMKSDDILQTSATSTTTSTGASDTSTP